MTLKSGLNISAARPVKDGLEIPLEYEPDTPMHHSFRGYTGSAWKHKLVRAAQILIAFLLVAAAGVWFFIDVEDLQYRGRFGQTSMNIAESFPDGYLGSQDQSITRSRALSRAEALGLHADEKDLQSFSAKERWKGQLDAITVQPLTHTEEKPSRESKVVFLTSGCCTGFKLDEGAVRPCNRHIMGSCTSLASAECYLKAAAQPPCQLKESPRTSYRDSYMAALRRAVPYLQELGWSSVEAYPDILQSASASGCPADDAAKLGILEALREADIVVAEASAASEVSAINPGARIVAIETSSSAVLPTTLLDDLDNSQICGIWRAQTLTNIESHDGPLLDGSAYLAKLEGAAEEPHYHAKRHPSIPESARYKIVPLLSHAYRYRYPLDCGGNFQHIRLVGLFEQNASHSNVPRTIDRKVDVAYMPSLTPSEDPVGISTGGQKLLSNHRNSLTKVLRDMQSAHAELQIKITSSNSGSYEEYLQQLQDTKILITTGSADEWSEQDFDAIFSGCLLMKVDPDSIRTYPDLFIPVKHVLEAQPGWASVPTVLLEALKVFSSPLFLVQQSFNRPSCEHLQAKHSSCPSSQTTNMQLCLVVTPICI